MRKAEKAYVGVDIGTSSVTASPFCMSTSTNKNVATQFPRTPYADRLHSAVSRS